MEMLLWKCQIKECNGIINLKLQIESKNDFAFDEELLSSYAEIIIKASIHFLNSPEITRQSHACQSKMFHTKNETIHSMFASKQYFFDKNIKKLNHL